MTTAAEWDEALELIANGLVRKPHKKTLDLMKAAIRVLEEYHPMTVRQTFYQLVSRQVITNSEKEYDRLSRALVDARKLGIVKWEWIKDRTRQPHSVGMWNGLPDFFKTVRNSYRRDVWADQEEYVECWIEKDALSGIFSEITEEYGVTLVTCRGFASWSVFPSAADRFEKIDKPVTILYFGDFDPSGMDMVRHIKESLEFFDLVPKIEKIALTLDDISEYNIPPNPTKSSDTRSAKFIEKYGDIAAELDALPVPVLEEKIRGSIKGYIDLDSFDKTIEVEETDLNELDDLLKGWGER